VEGLILAIVILQVAVLLLVIAAVVFLAGASRRSSPERFEASIRERFLAFQSEIQNQLNAARQELGQSKDIMSGHTIKTLETIRDMGATIQKIVQQQEESQKLGQSLKDLLQAPKLRGSYGEAILEEMLERVLPKGLWDRQVPIGGKEHVDAAVRFKDVLIPVDAKFPRDDYRRYMEAGSPEEKARAWKDYENAVKVQIRSIASKYVKPELGTSEFALMFIPSEAIYYETIAEKNALGQPSTLQQYAQEQRVIPVSPNTFYAFLQVIILGVRHLEVIKNAQKLQAGLRALEKSFEQFFKRYEEMGRQVEKAAEAYRTGEKHIDRYRRQLEAALRLEGLPEEADDSLPPPPEEET
jgi:DNA recombination protein RmuC